jgi:hypothetical protein
MEQGDAQFDRAQDRAQAMSDVGAAIAAIEAHGRQPDPWERASLAWAIDLLWRGEYVFPSVLADLAMTPAAKRSPRQNISSDPVYERWGLHTLKAAFQDACAQPLRQHPDLLQPPTFQAQIDK